MMTPWEKLKAWFAARGGFVHVVAAGYGLAVLAYAQSPPFHQFVIDVWAKTPASLREAGAAAIGILALYTSPKKEN